MYASAQTRAGVQAMLQQWKDAYGQRDLEGALAVIAPDEDVVGIGTGPDEWRVGPDQFKAQMERDFAQAEALSVAYEPLVVSEAGPVAWVAGRPSVQARVEGQEPELDRSIHRCPGAPGRPLVAHADPLLAARS
jgi:ketosteroid isomerase-like protein